MVARGLRRSFPILLPLIALAGSSAAQSNVLVVDRSGAGQYVQIHEAVLAAQEGDTILVRPPVPVPVYEAFQVIGKSLTIVGDSTTQLVGVRGIEVHGLADGQTVVLAGLHANSQGIGIPPGNPALWLHDNLGWVRVVGCSSTGYGSYASPALAIETSTRAAAFARCTLTGGFGRDGDESEAGPGGIGLLLRDAVAISFDSAIVGGQGGTLWLNEAGSLPGTGGIGAMLERVSGRTALLALNTAIAGGAGGRLEGCFFLPFVGGTGGTGMVVGPGTIATHLDSTLAAGTGGPATSCGGSPGPDGVNLLNAGRAICIAGPHLAFTTPTVAREGQGITLSFQGTPGDQVFLIEGRATTARLQFGGALVVKPSHVLPSPRLPIGTIQLDGSLAVPYTVPAVASGAEHLWLQAYAVHAGLSRMGGFSVVTVLDSIY